LYHRKDGKVVKEGDDLMCATRYRNRLATNGAETSNIRRPAMSEVHKITIQLQRPRGAFPGKVAIGHYCVADGFVILTDEAGKPTGDSKRHLDADADARLIACRMLHRRESAKSSSSSFNGPIAYPKLRY
jgi:hypothetical protein